MLWRWELIIVGQLDDQPSDWICPLDNAAHDISHNVQCVSHDEIPDAAHNHDHSKDISLITGSIMTPAMILLLMSNMS